MKFTDEDLKQLKELVRIGVDPQFLINDYESLLARLEAAERILALKPNQHRRTLMAAWRKAAGK